jgi:hypothetical protein
MNDMVFFCRAGRVVEVAQSASRGEPNREVWLMHVEDNSRCEHGMPGAPSEAEIRERYGDGEDDS